MAQSEEERGGFPLPLEHSPESTIALWFHGVNGGLAPLRRRRRASSRGIHSNGAEEPLLKTTSAQPWPIAPSAAVEPKVLTVALAGIWAPPGE